MPPILIIPGWTNSGPEHWQSRWQAALPNARRVEQRDWDRPERPEWVEALAREIARCQRPVLVAHSLGCLTVAHWARQSGAAVRAALLVAPPDPTSPDLADVLRDFAPVPREPLAFSSIVVASEDDPYADFGWSRALAATWGSRFVSAGRAGHINTAAGFGPWPAGERLLEDLLRERRPDAGLLEPPRRVQTR
jgi:predicted alpha/beta hydrolase family esterase